MFLCAFLVTKVLHDIPFCTKVIRIFSADVPIVSDGFCLFRNFSATELF